MNNTARNMEGIMDIQEVTLLFMLRLVMICECLSSGGLMSELQRRLELYTGIDLNDDGKIG